MSQLALTLMARTTLNSRQVPFLSHTSCVSSLRLIDLKLGTAEIDDHHTNEDIEDHSSAQALGQAPQAITKGIVPVWSFIAPLDRSLVPSSRFFFRRPRRSYGPPEIPAEG